MQILCYCHKTPAILLGKEYHFDACVPVRPIIGDYLFRIAAELKPKP